MVKYLQKNGIKFGLAIQIILLGLKVSAESRLGTFKLKNCSANGKNCFVIEGERAEGSDFSPLYYFRNAQIQFQVQKKIKDHFQGAEGYFDLAAGRVVFTVNSTHQEQVFDLQQGVENDNPF
jgi:hypothetical protein